MTGTRFDIVLVSEAIVAVATSIQLNGVAEQGCRAESYRGFSPYKLTTGVADTAEKLSCIGV